MTLQHAEVLLLALTLLATVTISALTLRQTTVHFRLQRTSEFVSRFNSKDLVAMREEVDRWVESGETPKALYLRSGAGSKAAASPSPDAQQALAMVANLRTMTNFFQEFGTAIKAGSLDERYAHELLGGICLRYAKELRPFILETRQVRGRPQAYEEVFLLEKRMMTYEDGPAAMTARGYWSRLYARALFVQDANGHKTVLVSCELWSMPAGLADRAIELAVRGHPDLADMRRGQFLIAATHTHHSPANFSSSPAYNQFASNRAGFDPDLFDFLARRTASAIIAAAANAAPATLTRGRTRVPGVARNRSMGAFLLDAEAPQFMAGQADIPLVEPCPDFPDARCTRAVDPRLETLEFRRTDNGKTIGAAVFMATHPTTIRAECELYTGELFGAAATLTEEDWARAQGDRPVIAFFNGAEGDVSAQWIRQDRADTLRLAQLMARGVRAASARSAPVDPDVVSSLGLLHLPGQEVQTPDHTYRVSTTPMPGVATLGGAEDGRTLFHDLGWVEGVYGPPAENDQGSKIGALDIRFAESKLRLTRLLPLFVATPKIAPIGVSRIGTLTLVAMPFECTTMMGHRIARAVAEELHTSADDVFVVGLANEYLSYVATPEEYQAQHYEGASTLYGPGTGPAITQFGRRMANSAAKAQPCTTYCYNYSPGSTRHFLTERYPDPPTRYDSGLELVVQNTDTGDPLRDNEHFEWTEPSIVHLDAERAVLPSVAIECRNAQGSWSPLVIRGVSQDDHGLTVVCVLLRRTETDSTWSAIWLASDDVAPGTEIRFAVRTTSGAMKHSKP